MELNQDSTPLAEPEPAPATVRILGLVLQIQAGCYLLAALIAGVAYLVRGADTLSLGWYATTRTHPLTMLAVGIGVGGLLFWLARRIPAKPIGLHRLINITELVLLADGVLGFILGIFNLWSVLGLLAAVAALWCLRHEDTNRYLD
jgi:hypothetical protein